MPPALVGRFFTTELPEKPLGPYAPGKKCFLQASSCESQVCKKLKLLCFGGRGGVMPQGMRDLCSPTRD